MGKMIERLVDALGNVAPLARETKLTTGGWAVRRPWNGDIIYPQSDFDKPAPDPLTEEQAKEWASRFNRELIVRAVLEELEDPTPEMLEAGNASLDDLHVAPENDAFFCFEAMIRCALGKA